MAFGVVKKDSIFDYDSQLGKNIILFMFLTILHCKLNKNDYIQAITIIFNQKTSFII